MLSPFESIQIALTLRSQWQFLQSVYLEVSKKRSPVRPSQYVRKALDSGACEGLWIDYNSLLSQLERVFDPPEIKIFDFDAINNCPLGVIGTYLNHVGMKELERIDLCPASKGKSNISPQPLASWIANILSEPRVATPGLVDIASSCLINEFGPGTQTSIFTRDEYNALFRHFDKLNSHLNHRFSMQCPSSSFIAAEARANTIYRDQVSCSLLIRIARKILRK
jgi:hypothetical protein